MNKFFKLAALICVFHTSLFTQHCHAQTNTQIILIDITTPQVVNGRAITGDPLNIAGAKINGNVLWLGLQTSNLWNFSHSLSNLISAINPMTTNYAPGNGYVPMSTNNATGGFIWIPVSSIGGTNASALIWATSNLDNISTTGSNVIASITAPWVTTALNNFVTVSNNFTVVSNNFGIISNNYVGTSNALAIFLATNAPAPGTGNYLSNWFGLGTNANFVGYSTNVSLTLSTNGGFLISTYQAVVTATQLGYDTNTIQITGAGESGANGNYLWNTAGTDYTNPSTYKITFGAFPFIETSGGSTRYESLANFPFNWTILGGTAPAPAGGWAYILIYSYVTNTFEVISPLTTPSDPSGASYSVTAQKINATGYLMGGNSYSSILRGMQYPFLWVTNCAGAATNFNGPFANTWSGFYTNLVTGTLLIPAGYSDITINGTNFTTQSSLICSNLVTLYAGTASAFSNPSNVLGYYNLSIYGRDNLPTNQPLVTALFQWPPGITTNCTVTIGGVNHTADFTNGLLQGFQ